MKHLIITSLRQWRAVATLCDVCTIFCSSRPLFKQSSL